LLILSCLSPEPVRIRQIRRHGNRICRRLPDQRKKRGLKDWEKPLTINTDKAPTYGAAISELKAEGKCPWDTEHRQIKYLNNSVEADHGRLKHLIRPVRGFKTLNSADATIKGFEVMRALRKGQAGIFNHSNDVLGGALMAGLWPNSHFATEPFVVSLCVFAITGTRWRCQGEE
jgi:hypothetical protein